MIKRLKFIAGLIGLSLLTAWSPSFAGPLGAGEPSPIPSFKPGDRPLFEPRTPLSDDIQLEMRVGKTGKKTIWATWPKGSKKVGDTITIPKGTPYFHWADYADYKVVKAQGGYNEFLFKYLFRYTEKQFEAMGPGFYTSLSPVDSASFGPRVLMGKAPTDLVMVDNYDIMSASVNGVSLGSDMVGVAERLQRLNVDGILQGPNATWMSFIRSKPVSKLVKPTPQDLLTALANLNRIALKKATKSGGALEHYYNPVVGVQTLYQKGYGDQAPNDWTAGNAGGWDKIMRNEPLSADEIEAVSKEVMNDTTLLNGLYSKIDPHFLNIATFFENQAAKMESPDMKAKLDDFSKRKAAVDKIWNDYYMGADYQSYQKADIAYFNSPAYKQYETAQRNYTTSPEYKAYKAAEAKFEATPEYRAYQKALKAYRTSPAFVAYNQQAKAWNQSPTMQAWYKNPSSQMPDGGPTPPAGEPKTPAGQPTPPPYPQAPPEPKAPPQPTTPKLDPSTELQGDELKVYNFRQFANTVRTGGADGEFKPTPLPSMSKKDKLKLEGKAILSCITRYLTF